MLNGERTLYLHAGGLKTGSTALQIYLQNNADKLRDVGVSYEGAMPLDRDDQFICGNGNSLLEAIFGQSDSHLRSIIERYFDGRARAICSSENFAHLSTEDWIRLKCSCREIGVEPMVIYFVRNFASYIRSVYVHCVKNHGEWRSFREAVTDEHRSALYDSNYSALIRIRAAFPCRQIRVFHYETERNRLDSAFMEPLGLDARLFDKASVGRSINRGLSDFELSMAQKANRIYADFGLGAMSETLSNSLALKLIYSRPSLKCSHTVPSDLRQFMIDRHQGDADWINRTFFTGKQVVSVFDAEAGPADGTSNLDEDEKTAIAEDAFAWAATHISDLYIGRGRAVLSAYLDAASVQAIEAERPVEGVPDDFDPVRYLLLNPDLIEGRVNPYQHYVEFGHSEGRRYLWRRE